MLLLSNNYAKLFAQISIIIFAVSICYSCSDSSKALSELETVLCNRPDSTLDILKKIPYSHFKSAKDRAYYGYLLYNAAELADRTIYVDSIITNSINYYAQQKQDELYGKCKYLQACQQINKQQFDKAAVNLLAAESSLLSTNEKITLGKLNLKLATIAAIQREYNYAERRILESKKIFNTTSDKYYQYLALIHLSRIYRLQNKIKLANKINDKCIKEIKNKQLLGFLFNEKGITLYKEKKFDEACRYFRKSIDTPSKIIQRSTVYICYAEALFDKEQYDSSFYSAKQTLKYNATYFNRRDAYRIMTNYMYMKNDLKTMGQYIAMYQNYNDSVHLIENQDNISTIEKIYNQSKENESSHHYLIWGILLTIGLSASAVGVIYWQYRRNKKDIDTLSCYKQELTEKNEAVINQLKNKLEKERALREIKKKKAGADERATLDKTLFETCLNLSNKKEFEREMNATFNHIVDELNTKYEGITQKEIIWCCMSLLSASNTEKLHVLDATPESMYKLKQRLAKKLNLKSTRDMDEFLRRYTE